MSDPAWFRPGCYALEYSQERPKPFVDLGTLRAEATGAGWLTSGDLYHWGPGVSPPHSPGRRIPQYPAEHYRFYLRGESLDFDETDSAQLEWRFVVYEFSADTGQWQRRQTMTALLRRVAGKNPASRRVVVCAGPVLNRQGRVAGTLKLRWLCPHLRRAHLRLMTPDNSPLPLANSEQLDWVKVFAHPDVNWKLTVALEGSGVRTVGAPRAWTLAELHDLMGRRPRARSATPAAAPDDWVYSLICVQRIEGAGFERGVMFDWGTNDANGVPREGAALAAGWEVPSSWGIGQGQTFGQLKDVYFRTAVHEIGHAMGLRHDLHSGGFMNTTDELVAQSTSRPIGQRFPDNIVWGFNRGEAYYLRHGPDIAIRPGGMPWPGGDADPRATVLALPKPRRRSRADVHLVVWAGSSFLPFGAPLRLHFRLHQLSSEGLLLPENLQVKGGFVSCSVTGLTPAQPTRLVRSYVACEDATALKLVKPGGAVDGTATLLWSDDGMLLPQPGRYRVQVEVAWPLAGEWQTVAGSVHVVVAPLPGEQASHFSLANEGARRVLQEVLRDLVVPSAAFTQAGAWLEALSQAKPKPVWSHYAYFQWKRWALPGPGRSLDLAKALGALDRDAVLTTSELKKIKAWLENQRAQGAPLAAEIKRVRGLLRDWNSALAAWNDPGTAGALSSHTPVHSPPDSSESL